MRVLSMVLNLVLQFRDIWLCKMLARVGKWYLLFHRFPRIPNTRLICFDRQRHTWLLLLAGSHYYTTPVQPPHPRHIKPTSDASSRNRCTRVKRESHQQRLEMSSLNVASFCHCGFLTYLMLFSFYISIASSVSLDLTELRNKVAKIKVNPRGNLWATGEMHTRLIIVLYNVTCS